MRAQAHFDIAQALAPGQLCERHAQELIQARKAFDISIALVLGHSTPKRMQRQMPHQLRKHIAAFVHGDVLGKRTSSLAESTLKSMTPRNYRESKPPQSLARARLEVSRTVLARAKIR